MNAIVTGSRLGDIADRAPLYQSLMFGENLQRIGMEKSDLWSADPRSALAFIFRYHAFARAGGEQAGYGEYAFNALQSIQSRAEGSIPATTLWDRFVDQCEMHDTGVNERVNRGVVTGLTELVNDKGNLFLWVESEIKQTATVESVFEELMNVKGIGRKIATFIIRDLVWFLGMEREIQDDDLQYLQPIDRWVRRVAEQLFPELEGASREQIAAKVARQCVQNGISGAEFNQGAWYLSRVEFEGEIERLRTGIQTGLKSKATG